MATHAARYTREEYIAVERLGGVRHEFLDGNIYAMAGGSPEHAAIAANVTTLLNNALRGRRCRVHSSDLRVRVTATGLETYPDVTVICDKAEPDPADAHAVTNLIVVVEVTSPSTVDWDRGEKLEHYQRIPSLREIVFVAHDDRRVEVVRREDDGRWTRHDAQARGAVKLVSLCCELSVDEIYRDPLEG